MNDIVDKMSDSFGKGLLKAMEQLADSLHGERVDEDESKILEEFNDLKIRYNIPNDKKTKYLKKGEYYYVFASPNSAPDNEYTESMTVYGEDKTIKYLSHYTFDDDMNVIKEEHKKYIKPPKVKTEE